MRDRAVDAEQADHMQQNIDAHAPRFVLVEPPARVIALRLASIGWHPLATATLLAAIQPADLAEADALVVCCTERLLLSSGFQADLGQLSGALPRVAVVAAEGVETAAYAARLGWRGFVAAESAAVDIACAISMAARGELAFPPSVMSGLVRTLARVAPLNAFPAPLLTPRQRQIVTLVAQGATDTEIATLLRISPATATKHVQNARRRLHARTRGQLVAAIGSDRLTIATGRAS